MNDNDLFGEIDSYLDTIDAKSTTGSDTALSLPSFPSPTSSPISRVANNLFAPPTPPSSSTPPLRRVGPAISPLKTGFNDANVSSGSTSASFVGNGGGGGIVSTCSGNGSSMTSVVQSTSKSPYSKSEDEVGSSYVSPNSPVQRVSLNAPRPYSSVCGKRRLDEDFPFPKQRSGYENGPDSLLSSTESSYPKSSRGEDSFSYQGGGGTELGGDQNGYRNQDPTSYSFRDDPGSTENLDLPGGYPGNSSGQLNSPDGGNNYCQSSNNNNNIPQHNRDVNSQQRETIKTKILGVLEATGLSGNLTIQDIRTLKRLSEIAKSTELTQQQKAQEVSSLIRYNPNIHRLLVTLKNEKPSSSNNQRTISSQNRLMSPDSLTGSNSRDPSGPLSRDPLTSGQLSRDPSASGPLSRDPLTSGPLSRDQSVITSVPASSRLNASSSAYGDMISQGGQAWLSGHMAGSNQQGLTTSSQHNSSVFQSTAPSSEGIDSSLSGHLSNSLSSSGPFQAGGPAGLIQAGPSVRSNVPVNNPISNSGDDFISRTSLRNGATTSDIGSSRPSFARDSGLSYSSPGNEMSPTTNRRVNSSGHDSSSSTLSSLLASPSLHPGMNSPSYSQSSLGSPAYNQPQNSMVSSPFSSPVGPYGLEGSSPAYRSRSPGVGGPQRSRSMMGGLSGSPRQQKPGTSWNSRFTPTGSGYLPGYPGSPRGIPDQDMRNSPQGFFPGIYSSHGPVRPYMPNHMHPDHRQIYLERTHVGGGMGPGGMLMDPSDPRRGPPPPGYMGYPPGMAGRPYGSGRIPLPPSMGVPGGAGGYRPPYPQSMYLNEQQQELYPHQMGEGSPGYRNIRPMMSPHNHMDLHYQQGTYGSPMTPGTPYGSPMTPGMSPMTPMTPGPSPMTPGMSPMNSGASPMTPGGMMSPMTPGSTPGGMTPGNTPGGNTPGNTPGGMTPGLMSPMTPSSAPLTPNNGPLTPDRRFVSNGPASAGSNVPPVSSQQSSTLDFNRYSTPAGFQSPEQRNDYNNTTSSENMSDYLSNSNTLTTGTSSMYTSMASSQPEYSLPIQSPGCMPSYIKSPGSSRDHSQHNLSGTEDSGFIKDNSARSENADTRSIFQELAELPLSTPPDTSMLLKDEWKGAATEKRVKYLERLEKSLASSGVPASQVAGIASNIEKDAFMKADTFEMYETKLVANLALYLPQNSDDQPDSTTILDNIINPSSSTSQDQIPESSGQSMLSSESANQGFQEPRLLSPSSSTNPALPLSPKLQAGSPLHSQMSGIGSSTNLPGGSTNPPGSYLNNSGGSGSQPGGPGSLPGGSSGHPAGLHMTGHIVHSGGQTGAGSSHPSSSLAGNSSHPGGPLAPSNSTIPPPSFLPSKFQQEWGKAIGGNNDPSSVDSGIGSPRSCPNIYSPKVLSVSPQTGQDPDNSTQK